MLRRLLAITAAAAIAVTGLAASPPPPAAAADDVQLPNGEVVPVEHVELVDGVFVAINEYRESQGLLPLRFAPELFQLAQDWSDLMVANDAFQHRKTHWTLYPAGWTGGGEIIAARSNADAEALVRQWINSPGHEALMVSDSTVMGPGVELDTGDVADYYMYGTVNFGNHAPGAATYASITEWIESGGATAREDVVGDVTGFSVAEDGAITITGWALDFSDRALSSTVRLTLDGRSSVLVRADSSISRWFAGEWRSGHEFRWTFPAEVGVRHSVCAVAIDTYGDGDDRSLGCQQAFQPLPDPEVAYERVAGSNRYDTAVQISERYNEPAAVDTVFLATGAKYPDALSLAPAAAQEGNALLLTPQSQLWPTVEAELTRLAPETVVIVGAEDSVSADVEQQVAAALPEAEIERLAGENRYETSVMIAAYAFPNATLAYVASGQLFPDALSAAPVAATRNAPVILTPQAQLPHAVSDYVAGSDLSQLIIAGGAPSVSTAVEAQLQALVGSEPQRIAGDDRYETNRLLAATADSGSQTEVLLASGLNFPDALAGAAVAEGAGPLLLSRHGCVPTETVDLIIDEYLPERLVVLGGTPTLSVAAAELTRCG